ncbi:hypothetical protein AB3Y40_07435 [Yoonia sp. R2331]|uniref:hypothetical protein n=1 Tax=Yoonia sp. R2331 TaxID=3237238 RepID=UPI0034E4476D
MTGLQIGMRRNGLIVAVIGVLFGLSVLAPLHAVAHIFLQLAYWPMASVPAGQVVPVGVLLAISGGLTVGIGMSIWAVGTYVAGEAPVAAAKVVKITAWSWFAVDSTCSILAGAPFNAVLNLSFLALMLASVRNAGSAVANPA